MSKENTPIPDIKHVVNGDYLLIDNVKQHLKDILLSAGSDSQNVLLKGIARYLIKTEITADSKCPTAYARPLKGGKLKIGVNPDFYFSLPSKYRFPLLVHEVFHIIMKHFTRFEFSKNLTTSILQNIALDCAINQLIELFAEDFTQQKDCHFAPVNFYSFDKKVKESGYKETVEPMQSAEYYLKILLSLPKEEQQKIANTIEIKVFVERHDEHAKDGSGDDGEGDGQKIVKGKGKPGDKDGKDEAKGQGKDPIDFSEIGKIINDIERDLREVGMGEGDLLKLGLGKETGAVPWKKILKSFLAAKISTELRTDRSKAHKKYGLALPKRRFDYEAEFTLLLDTTGSMSADLPLVYAEVEKFAKMYDAPFDIFVVDTDLHGPFHAKNATAFKALNLPQYGGTDFTCIENLRSLGRPVIFFTDTIGEWPNKKVNYPLLVLKTYPGDTPEWARAIDVSEEFKALRQKAA